MLLFFMKYLPIVIKSELIQYLAIKREIYDQLVSSFPILNQEYKIKSSKIYLTIAHKKKPFFKNQSAFYPSRTNLR